MAIVRKTENMYCNVLIGQKIFLWTDGWNISRATGIIVTGDCPALRIVKNVITKNIA
ncbi:hypothetical protein GCM10011325_43100 [Dyadobacter sediminis]|nr:hypothetical protein GCM10011325_43100 [Dyadobacter sediminis]